MLGNRIKMDDRDLFALCVWREARGEGEDGMRAVAHVIKNRVGYPGFGLTLYDVIMGRNQFTSMSVSSDPEYSLQPKSDDLQFTFCQNLIPSILDNSDQDITKGAHYYANLHNCTSGWFYDTIVLDSKHHPITAQIGRHTFFL
jgi:N-acetylmuramoyl-L-alanine amidase